VVFGCWGSVVCPSFLGFFFFFFLANRYFAFLRKQRNTQHYDEDRSTNRSNSLERSPPLKHHTKQTHTNKSTKIKACRGSEAGHKEREPVQVLDTERVLAQAQEQARMGPALAQEQE